MIRLPLLDDAGPDSFPEPRDALTEPNGLLAMGGDLSPARLRAAYARGIFPWFGEGEPILWWSPDPRCVFRTDALYINRSLRRQLRGKPWRVTVDHAFEPVIRACASPRRDGGGSWIGPAMIEAYLRLHREGDAHSVEVWDGGCLAGGIYGVAVGQLFCGESMFSAQSGGSRLALVALAGLLQELGFPWLDAQVANPHTLSLGAMQMPRAAFLQEVRRLGGLAGVPGSWAGFTPRLAQPCGAET